MRTPITGRTVIYERVTLKDGTRYLIPRDEAERMKLLGQVRAENLYLPPQTTQRRRRGSTAA